MSSSRLLSAEKNWLQWDLHSCDKQSHYLNLICDCCDQKVKDQADEFHHCLSQQWITLEWAHINEAVYWIWNQKAVTEAWIHLLSMRCWTMNEQISDCLSHSLC